jgi:hypothetical protein
MPPFAVFCYLLSDVLRSAVIKRLPLFFAFLLTESHLPEPIEFKGNLGMHAGEQE